mmetsp:Transcript_17502/g.52643  ORF Transcript_17502/g.52643 Transcript_17502/m.52643 type:complete len:335 (-) Transcript_17502:912-1916(-)
MVDEHPEEHAAQVVHVFDLLALQHRRRSPIRRGQLAQDRLDRLQHLAVVHDEPPVLDGELNDVADLPERVRRQEVEVPLDQLARHPVTASCKRVLAVQELRERLPHDLVVGVVRGIDVNPTFEPVRLLHKEDGRLVSSSLLRLLHDEEVRVLGVELHEALDNQLRALLLLQAALDVVCERLDAILIQGLQSRDEHGAKALCAHLLEDGRRLLVGRSLRLASASSGSTGPSASVLSPGRNGLPPLRPGVVRAGLPAPAARLGHSAAPGIRRPASVAALVEQLVARLLSVAFAHAGPKVLHDSMRRPRSVLSAPLLPVLRRGDGLLLVPHGVRQAL